MRDFPILEQATARLVTELSLDSITPDALQGARVLLQDQLSLQVGCASLPWNKSILEVTRKSHGPGMARVALTGDKMNAADAAFVNATYGHSFEYDDAHSASLSHPGSCVISAALAVGEELDATMDQVLEGIVAGYEVYTRIGSLAAPDLLNQGFQPHAVLSPFGAAAVVAKMRGFNLETTLHALSIAYSHCSGTTEYTSSGGSVKRVHSGIGTRNGIRSADMAEAGITGPSAFLTGAKGFFKTLARGELATNAAELFSLEQPFEIANPLIKPYCCCAFNHTFIDGARNFIDRSHEISTVDLKIRASGDVVVGNSNTHAYSPTHIEHLQYSLPFQFALSALGQGNGYETHIAYMEGRLDLSEQGEIHKLAQRVKIHPSSELDKSHPTKMVADISITFQDGSTENLFIEDSKGSAWSPLTQADLDAKFMDLATKNLGTRGASRLHETITSCEGSIKAAELVSMMVA